MSKPTREQEIAALEAARNQFLEDNPHLKPIQEELDRVLDACPTPEARTKALGIMMATKLKELRDSLMDLSEILGKGESEDGSE